MGGFLGALKAVGKNRVKRAKQKYTGPPSGGGSDSDSGKSGGVASDIIQGAMRRKRGGKSRG